MKDDRLLEELRNAFWQQEKGQQFERINQLETNINNLAIIFNKSEN